MRMRAKICDRVDSAEVSQRVGRHAVGAQADELDGEIVEIAHGKNAFHKRLGSRRISQTVRSVSEIATSRDHFSSSLNVPQ